MIECRHCRNYDVDHVEGKCLYLPTMFEAVHCIICRKPQYSIIGYSRQIDGVTYDAHISCMRREWPSDYVYPSDSEAVLRTFHKYIKKHGENP